MTVDTAIPIFIRGLLNNHSFAPINRSQFAAGVLVGVARHIGERQHRPRRQRCLSAPYRNDDGSFAGRIKISRLAGD